MTRRGTIALWALLSAALAAAPSGAEPTAAPEDVRSSLLARSVSGRLTLGIAVSHTWLEDDRRSGPNGYDNANRSGNFLGSLWGLDPKQSYVPGPFLEYRIVSAFGLGVAYNQLTVKTLDWGDAERTWTAGDGDLRMRGAQVFAFGRLANRTRVTPYVRVGFAYYWSAFFESPGWATPGRSFEVSDTKGWLAGAGLRAALWKGVGLEGCYEHEQLADVKAAVRFTSGGKGTKGAFPVRNDAVSLRLSYAF
jgi:opacity protein-like surface antigen